MIAINIMLLFHVKKIYISYRELFFVFGMGYVPNI